MSTTSVPPVLQGRGAAALSWERDALVLERPGRKLTIPARAIARVRAEGRSVTVELRAPAGAAPSVHGVEAVSPAAAGAFADAVNALLARAVEGVDGGALVVVHAHTKTWLQTFRRRLGWVLLGCLGGVLALSVTTAVAGEGADVTGVSGAIASLGVLAVAASGFGAVCAWPWLQEGRRRRRGVTVPAVRAHGPGAYQYTDDAGATHVFSHPGTAASVRVGYLAHDPADVLVLRDPSTRLMDITLGSCFLLAGASGIAVVVWLAATTILGGALP